MIAMQAISALMPTAARTIRRSLLRLGGIGLIISQLQQSKAQVGLPAAWIECDCLLHLTDCAWDVALRSQQIGSRCVDTQIVWPLFQQQIRLFPRTEKREAR